MAAKVIFSLTANQAAGLRAIANGKPVPADDDRGRAVLLTSLAVRGFTSEYRASSADDVTPLGKSVLAMLAQLDKAQRRKSGTT